MGKKNIFYKVRVDSHICDKSQKLVLWLFFKNIRFF